MTEPAIFETYDATTAPPRARPLLSAAARAFGFLPSPLARWAASPALIEGFEQLRKLFERSTLSELEQEVVVMVVAHANECEVCMALHSAILTRAQAEPELLGALRAGQPPSEPRLQALTAFTRSVLSARGQVEAPELRRFLEAGFTREQALEVVLGVGATTLSTFANRLTRAPLDAAFAPFEWKKRS